MSLNLEGINNDNNSSKNNIYVFSDSVISVNKKDTYDTSSKKEKDVFNGFLKPIQEIEGVKVDSGDSVASGMGKRQEEIDFSELDKEFENG